MDERLASIRADLTNGKTINQVCYDYDLSFSELVDLMRKYDNPISPARQSENLLYIMPRNNHFYIRKAGVHYGTYKSLSDAKKVKRWFQYNGWDKRNIDRACRICGVTRCKKENNEASK